MNKKAKLFCLAYNLETQRQNFESVKLQGLYENKNYKIEETNLYPGVKGSCAENGKIFSGEYLMKIGLNVSSNKSLTSSVIEISEIK